MVGWLDVLARELTLFACVGILVGGVDDFAVDCLFFLRALCHRLRRSREEPRLAALVAPTTPRIAIFVAAWDEAAVIGRMLRTALDRIEYPEYAIYVGTYPNDRATIEAVSDIAQQDERIRIVVGDRPGPTTKADCLNAIWCALRRDEAADGVRFDAIALHDAEDVVHPGELQVQATYLATHDLVQIPVLPLIDRRSRLIACHYADEFAEAHAKQLPIRTMLGAGMPLAGVGCAIRRDMLERIAADRGGYPFDASSLTEDYELGLTVKRLRGRSVFARVAEDVGGAPVAVRALFPGHIDAAVRQKTRWMIGIALAGWDRVGWGPVRDWSDHWMRMRDRRVLLAVMVLAAAYVAIVANAATIAAHQLFGIAARPTPPTRHILLLSTLAILFWRLTVRAFFVGRTYGRNEAILSIPRAVVGNIIALLAARRAVFRYIAMLRGHHVQWDKTTHHFPDDIEQSTT